MEVNCYWKPWNRWLRLITMLLPGPDLHCVGQHLPAKHKFRPKIKSYHLSAGLLALCHMVNPALLLHYVFKKVRWEPEVATFMIKTLNFSRVIRFNWLAKIEFRGPGPLVVNIIVNYCCTQKMLKETETEETIVFFCQIFIIGSISIGGGPLWLHLCPVALGRSSYVNA